MNNVISRYEVYANDQGSDMMEYLPYLRSVAKGNVLEIGTRWGISTTALLAGLQENGGHLYSVDVEEHCASLYPGHLQWTFIHGHSRLSTDRIKELIPPTLDVLFVDGDHSFAAALYDMETYGAMVRPGGLILAHDVNPAGITPELQHRGWAASPGAREAFDHYLSAHPDLQGHILPGRAGLGVIQVK